MHEFVGFNLSEHELITLVRHYRIDDKGHPWEPKEDMHALIQMELKRINFLNFDSLAHQMYLTSTSHLNYLPTSSSWGRSAFISPNAAGSGV